MSDMRKSLALATAMLCAVAMPLSAQETNEAPAEETQAPVVGDGATGSATDLSLGEVVGEDGLGEAYTAETFGDWEMRCIRTPDDQDPCQLYQLLDDAEGNSVAEISLFALPAGQQAAAGATIVTPLETLLTQQITIQVDGAQAKRYPFTWCSPIGCVARVGFTQAEIDAFKRGNRATMTIVPVAAPDQQVALDVSLAGFTAGYDAVAASNAALPE
ncbi:invasion associated locus B family protein [Plastorhodobacter daqingensis]|uniref:Invasion associated locus B family protein n=1 Tax=Plastorhodobacter daqingensis TaxID=1387281 RepID=A0ABW2UNS7_9RHOB